MDEIKWPAGTDGHSRRILSGEAKKLFFLDAADLREIGGESFGGWSRATFYSVGSLKACALRKYGAATLAKKYERRAKREEGVQQMRHATEAPVCASGVIDLTAPSPSRQPLAPGTAANAAQADPVRVRAALLKMLKKHMGFAESGGPGDSKFTMPLIDKATFAALIWRGADPTLSSLVKRGAWYQYCIGYEDVPRFLGLGAGGSAIFPVRWSPMEDLDQEVGAISLGWKECSEELNVYAPCSWGGEGRCARSRGAGCETSGVPQPARAPTSTCQGSLCVRVYIAPTRSLEAAVPPAPSPPRHARAPQLVR